MVEKGWRDDGGCHQRGKPLPQIGGRLAAADASLARFEKTARRHQAHGRRFEEILTPLDVFDMAIERPVVGLGAAQFVFAKAGAQVGLHLVAVRDPIKTIPEFPKLAIGGDRSG